MASEQSSVQPPGMISTVVKEEPPEEQPEIKSEYPPFYYETLTKEEVVLEDGMPTEQSPAQLPEQLAPIVKEESPEEQPETEVEYITLCYEMLPKEEPILEDEAAALRDDAESGNANSNGAAGKITKSSSTKGGTVKCAECDRTFNKQFELNRHIKWHNAIKLGLNRCNYCNKTFGTKGNLDRHIESHKKLWESTGATSLNPDEPALELELPLLVRRGKRSTKPSAEVTIEVILEEGGVEIIDEPEPDNETSSEPVEPIAELTEDGAIQCTECGRTFQTFSKLRKHIKWHKAIELGLYRCKYCCREFGSKGNLLRHIESHKRIWEESKAGGSTESHQGEPIEGNASPVRRGLRKQHTPPVTCPECGKVFKTKGKLGRHVAFHRAKKLGLFTCDLCNLRCQTSTYLHFHKLIHQKGEDRFTCHACHEKFKSRAELNKHQISHRTDPMSIKFLQQVIHNEDGTFHCTVCGKFFSIRAKALKHFRRHVQLATAGDSSSSTANRPESELYICDLCGKRWKLKSQIRRHMEVHKGIRYRTCLICHMKFESLSAFARHRVVHKTDEQSVRFREMMVQGEKGAFTCTACDKHFESRDKARNHLSKKHPA